MKKIEFMKLGVSALVGFLVGFVGHFFDWDTWTLLVGILLGIIISTVDNILDKLV